MVHHLKRVLLLTVLAAVHSATCTHEVAGTVKKVHLVFTHHLDVGLDLPLKQVDGCVGYATRIVQRYFDDFIPRALHLGRAARARRRTVAGQLDRFVYQVHSWIALMYVDCVPWDRVPYPSKLCPASTGALKCPTAAQVSAFEDGIKQGDIVWTHSPFDVNAGAVGEPSFFEAMVRDIPGELDARYRSSSSSSSSSGTNDANVSNYTNTNTSTRSNANTKATAAAAEQVALPSAHVWSNVDVKGFARSAIPLLLKSGITALYIGTNGHSPNHGGGLQPVVGNANATIFRWIDPVSNSSIPVLYHDGYGGYKATEALVVPSGEVAMVSYFRPDNSGPPDTLIEADSIFKAVTKNFPSATVIASSMDAFAAEALTPAAVASLPTTDVEWGDQWLTGVGTDPLRVARYREAVRARQECIEKTPAVCDQTSKEMKLFTRFLAKGAEHTQGVQAEDWSPGIAGLNQKADADTRHWSNAEFESVHNANNNKFEMGEVSWVESRMFTDIAVATLAAAHHPLADDIKHRFAAMEPTLPALDQNGLEPVANPAAAITCGDAAIAFNANGSISVLTLGGGIAAGGTSWLGPLLELSYVTYDARHSSWDARSNMTCSEPGCANPQAAVHQPVLQRMWRNSSSANANSGNNNNNKSEAAACLIINELHFDPMLHADYGAPTKAYAEYTVSPADRSVSVTLTWFNKSTTRLPESIMASVTTLPSEFTRGH